MYFKKAEDLRNKLVVIEGNHDTFIESDEAVGIVRKLDNNSFMWENEEEIPIQDVVDRLFPQFVAA